MSAIVFVILKQDFEYCHALLRRVEDIVQLCGGSFTFPALVTWTKHTFQSAGSLIDDHSTLERTPLLRQRLRLRYDCGSRFHDIEAAFRIGVDIHMYIRKRNLEVPALNEQWR